MELISGVTPDVILMPGFSLWFPDTADSSGNDFAHAPLPREHFILVSATLWGVVPGHSLFISPAIEWVYSWLFMYMEGHKNLSF